MSKSKKLEMRNRFLSSQAFSSVFSKKGFSLLELLIAVAIMSIVMLALYGTFFSVLNSQSRIEKELEWVRELRRFLDVFSSEIQSSFYKDGNSRTIFIGEKKGSHRRPVSSIGFTNFTHAAVKDGRPVSDMMAVEYFVEENPEGMLTLYKKIWNPYDGDKKHGFKVEILGDIEGFEVSYLNGKDWAKAWDSSLEKKLPDAVKVAIAVKDRGEVREFSTIARTRIR
jgi:general secretion pathway protein J